MKHESKDPIVIVEAKRTPMGAFQGILSTLSAPKLASFVLKDLFQKDAVGLEKIDEVYMGCVLSAGMGQAPARQAALFSGLPLSVSCTALNKVCGSGLKAVMVGAWSLQTGNARIVLAGGMESMSQAPYLLDKARSGYRMGHQRVIDHMFYDGLEDAYEPGRLMGEFAEATAQRFGLSRQVQDAFAINSTQKARNASKAGAFKAEITPVDVMIKKETQTFLEDETPLKVKLDKIPQLRPAFQKDGTVTAASSSSIADGAAAVMLMRESTCQQLGLTPFPR